jgi:hypothetical protein
MGKCASLSLLALACTTALSCTGSSSDDECPSLRAYGLMIRNQEDLAEPTLRGNVNVEYSLRGCGVATLKFQYSRDNGARWDDLIGLVAGSAPGGLEVRDGGRIVNVPADRS